MQPRHVKWASAIAIALTVYVLTRLLAGGDESIDGRVAVSGTVTHNGEPLELGTISFTPVAGANGFAAGGLIEEGEYSISQAEGPCAGSYTVQITAGKLERFATQKIPSFKFNRVIEHDTPLDFDLPPSESPQKPMAPAIPGTTRSGSGTRAPVSKRSAL